jgi:hypothetical protein
MISANCDFSDFVAAIKDKPFQEIIYLADQEATAAERIFYQDGANGDQKRLCGQKYAAVLKDLVSYMRSNVRFKHMENDYFELFPSILESAHANEQAALE